MLRIGITGGIGSGKSTVCQIFEQLGVPVFKADLETHELYNTNAVLRQNVIAAFGPEVYSGTELNRPKLAEIVFSNPKNLALLNALVHPMVFDLYEDWCIRNTAAPYTLKEAAILFESGSYKHLQFVVAVTAPLALRIERVMRRDGASAADIQQRISNQMDENELVKRSDFVIKNDSEAGLIEQVMKLHQEFLKLAPNAASIPFKS